MIATHAVDSAVRPVRITLRIGALQVRSSTPVAKRAFCEGVAAGILNQLAGQLGRIKESTTGTAESFPLTVPAVSLPIVSGFNFRSGHELGDRCAAALAAGMEATDVA